MNIDEDSCKFVSKNPHSFSTKYGVMGLTLGKELKTKLDKYCADRDIIKSKRYIIIHRGEWYIL